MAQEKTGSGTLADNVVHFARLLRGAGVPVGPGQVIAALEALRVAGIGRKADFYQVLHATLVTRREQDAVFDQAFALFWRKRDLLEKMMQMLLPEAVAARPPEKPGAGAQRVAEALAGKARAGERERDIVELDARDTTSDTERLATKDFEQMSADEIAEARRLLRDFLLPADAIRTRRFKPARHGAQADARATLRATIRSGGDVIQLARRARRTRPPPIVAIIDISGSMSSYSRMLLHFLHALTNSRERVHTFLFGTRLTNVTRIMKARDVDEALEKIAAVVHDWSGGTRINAALGEFNRIWSRRVLGQGAMVVLVTDGLEREPEPEGQAKEAPEPGPPHAALARQMERLHRSCRKLIWLNPLLRYEGFEARASGIRAMLPHVDEFRPAHNLQSLADLVMALDRRGPAADDPRSWLERLERIPD